MDERLTTLLASVDASRIPFSIEIFPPKTRLGLTNLQARLSRMATALKPLYVTVTWGAGGSTSAKSLELAEICQRQLGLPTVLHLTCTNMRKSMVDDALEACQELGIRNILALRGDPPREEYREESPPRSRSRSPRQDEFTWAIDLVRYIKKTHGDYFCVGVAGYPEGHADESHPEAGKQSVEHDLPYLVQKVEAGADFIMTQLTYDIDAYAAYEKRLRSFQVDNGTTPLSRIPIIPGLMPIQSYQIVKRITKLSHAKIPKDISDRIEHVKDDDNKVKSVGVDVLSELVEKMKALPRPDGVPRVLHFYTLNLEKSVSLVLERCQLLNHVKDPVPDESSSSDSDVLQDGGNINGASHSPQQRFSRRRASSVNAQPHNRVILDSSSPQSRHSSTQEQNGEIRHEAPERGSGIPATIPTGKHSLQISEGQGSLGREATWDDFPNGRWGPAHSPAYGEIDGYGPSLKVGPATARKLWGKPTTTQAVTDLFSQLITGDITSIPWSDEVDPAAGLHGPGSLRAETQVIRKELLSLIEQKQYWTLASQPAVDGVRSSDEVFGWGPRSEGFCFQKAFVEFFCSKTEWDNVLRQKLVDAPPDTVSWMKTDTNGIYESGDRIVSKSKRGSVSQRSSKNIPGQTGVNAVTWGVFRGKEIITPTIIESESFRAWGEEAYAIWSEWRRCYPRGSAEEKCLETLRKDLVLVNVVGQDFVGGHEGNGRGLWDLLLS